MNINAVLSDEVIADLRAMLPLKIKGLHFGVDRIGHAPFMRRRDTDGFHTSSYGGSELWMVVTSSGYAESKFTMRTSQKQATTLLLKISAVGLNSELLFGDYGVRLEIGKLSAKADNGFPEQKLLDAFPSRIIVGLDQRDPIVIRSIVIYGRDTTVMSTDGSEATATELLTDEIIQFNTEDGTVLVTRHDDRFLVNLAVYTNQRDWLQELELLNKRETTAQYQIRYRLRTD